MIMLQRDSHSDASTHNTAKIMLLSTLSMLSIVMLSGCSHLAINNGSVDYLKAKHIDPVQVPTKLQTRQIAPLYPVPIIAENAESKQLVLTNAKGNRYQLPQPKPINLNQTNTQSDSVVSEPQLVTDGNGYPLLKISGDITKIREVLDRSLNVANVKVTARGIDQLVISYENIVYKLRLGRIGDITILTILKTDETIADQGIATDLLELIIRNWSTSSI
jgi:hypothetical protein